MKPSDGGKTQIRAPDEPRSLKETVASRRSMEINCHCQEDEGTFRQSGHQQSEAGGLSCTSCVSLLSMQGSVYSHRARTCSGLSPSYPAPLGGSLALVDPSHCLQSGSSSLKNESSHSASVTQPYREHDKWSVCSLVHSKCSISGFEQTMVLNKLSKPIKHTHHQLHCLTMSSPTALLCGHHQQPPF